MWTKHKDLQFSVGALILLVPNRGSYHELKGNIDVQYINYLQKHPVHVLLSGESSVAFEFGGLHCAIVCPRIRHSLLYSFPNCHDPEEKGKQWPEMGRENSGTCLKKL